MGTKRGTETWRRGTLNLKRQLLESVRSIRCPPGYDPIDFEKHLESAVLFAQGFKLNGWAEFDVSGQPDPSKPRVGGGGRKLRDYRISEALPDRIVCRRQGKRASYIRGGWKPGVLPWY